MKKINRRSFLTKTAWAAGAGALAAGLKAPAWAAPVGANEAVRLGIIGCGAKARAHIKQFLMRKDVRVVALCEEATCAALAGHLDAGRTTVGTRVELDHLAATAVGRTVHAEAVLAEVDGARLRFDVRAHDESGDVAVGVVHRVSVDVERFLGKLR